MKPNKHTKSKKLNDKLAAKWVKRLGASLVAKGEHNHPVVIIAKGKIPIFFNVDFDTMLDGILPPKGSICLDRIGQEWIQR